MENKVPNEIVRGHINTVILSALVDSDKYGYEIRKEIESKSQGSFVLKEPTLYSSLKRLEEKGFVESYYGDEESQGGRRKYYKLTAYGREVTLKNLNEWKYSRSLMDKLITEEKVDLQNTPPPDSLDLNLTKKVSKKYIDGKSKEIETKHNAETKFIYNTENTNLAPKLKDPIIISKQNLFEEIDEEEKSSKEYKGLIDKLISTTKTHTAANFESIKAVEKIKSEEIINENPQKEEKISYSLLPKVENNGFIKTKERLQSEGFQIREYSKQKSQEYKQLLLINKLLFGTSVLTFATILIELIIVYFVFEYSSNPPLLGSNIYLIIAGCSAILPLIGAILCVVKPNKKIKAHLNLGSLIFYSLLIFVLGFLIVLAINLASGSAYDLSEVLTKIVFPALLLFNILTSTFFYALLFHSKKFHI